MLNSQQVQHQSQPVATLFAKLVLLCGCIMFSSGCSSHPEVTSPEALQLIKLVYTAANTHNVDRLKACRERFNELVDSGKLSPAEQRSFESIIADAEQGDWETAQNQSLNFARSQLR